MSQLVLKVGMIVAHSDGRRARVEDFQYVHGSERWYMTRDQHGSKDVIYPGLVELSSDQSWMS